MTASSSRPGAPSHAPLPPPSVGKLDKYVLAYATAEGLAVGRVRHWISFMMLSGALDHATHQTGGPRFVVKGGVALELRLYPAFQRGSAISCRGVSAPSICVNDNRNPEQHVWAPVLIQPESPVLQTRDADSGINGLHRRVPSVSLRARYVRSRNKVVCCSTPVAETYVPFMPIPKRVG